MPYFLRGVAGVLIQLPMLMIKSHISPIVIEKRAAVDLFLFSLSKDVVSGRTQELSLAPEPIPVRLGPIELHGGVGGEGRGGEGEEGYKVQEMEIGN
jgi:hypothetical protein